MRMQWWVSMIASHRTWAEVRKKVDLQGKNGRDDWGNEEGKAKK